MKSRKFKLIRTLIIIALSIVWVYAFNMYSNFDKTEPKEQFVQRVHDFYIDSWYNAKSLYYQDIEKLQEYKNEALNKLTYKQTIDYIAIQNKQKSGLIDNNWLNLIDETLELANEWIARVEVPEYLTIDSKTVVKEKEPTASELVFQNLLQ